MTKPNDFNYIDAYSEDWAYEFADFLNVEHKHEHTKFVSEASYTMLYHIASEFRNGEHYKEILDLCGVKEKTNDEQDQYQD